jgi:predicted RNA-binding Zn ribbon-like protein
MARDVRFASWEKAVLGHLKIGSNEEPHRHNEYASVMDNGSATAVLVSDPASERYAAALAPASLQRVQSFLNTRASGRPAEPDLLATATSANGWLRTLDWPTKPRMSTDDLAPLRELRQALQSEVEASPDTSEQARQSDLPRLLAKLGWKLRLKEGRLALAVEGTGWRQIAGTVLSDILAAQQHEQLWPRLKACRNPLCTVVFYDGSKNQSRVWHNTGDCGNLINLRASRARRRAQPS